MCKGMVYQESASGEEQMAKITLKPIAAELKKFRKELVACSKSSKGPQKEAMLAEIKRLDKLIKLVPVTCKHHTMGC
jgi:cell fate (sporulation/competence/biofilm development) regulator YmcA (YheA/YmcA/DUF963 family)